MRAQRQAAPRTASPAATIKSVSTKPDRREALRDAIATKLTDTVALVADAESRRVINNRRDLDYHDSPVS